VQHGVDATRLGKTLCGGLEGLEGGFERAVFNFPHSGSQRVHENRALLLGFFQSVRSGTPSPKPCTPLARLSTCAASSPIRFWCSRVVDPRPRPRNPSPALHDTGDDLGLLGSARLGTAAPRAPGSLHGGARRHVLAPGGQAHVTVKLRPPYSEWNVEAQARAAGFRLARVTHFDQSRFPGYRHQTTKARPRPPPTPGLRGPGSAGDGVRARAAGPPRAPTARLGPPVRAAGAQAARRPGCAAPRRAARG
jgi:hypothetical protein